MALSTTGAESRPIIIQHPRRLWTSSPPHDAELGLRPGGTHADPRGRLRAHRVGGQRHRRAGAGQPGQAHRRPDAPRAPSHPEGRNAAFQGFKAPRLPTSARPADTGWPRGCTLRRAPRAWRGSSTHAGGPELPRGPDLLGLCPREGPGRQGYPSRVESRRPVRGVRRGLGEPRPKRVLGTGGRRRVCNGAAR